MKITGIPMSNPCVGVKKDQILSTIQHSIFKDEDSHINTMVMSDGYCTEGIIAKSIYSK